MSTKATVSGYALVEGHGHYYFEAKVAIYPSSCRDSLEKRAYDKARKTTRLPKFSLVAIVEGFDIKWSKKCQK